ncbi:hypothetical protein PCE1_003958 [Barthelona sp. PCE]
MVAPTYTAELSPSGRAKCRTCSNKIEKDALRVMIETQRYLASRGMMVRNKEYHHATCLSTSRLVVEEISNYETLEEENQEILLAHFGSDPSKIDEEEEETDSEDESKKEELDEDEEGGLPRKLGALENWKLPEEDEVFSLKKLTCPKLKDELKANRQVQTGKKNDLMEKVCFGRLNGAFPACPKCSKGKLHFNYEEGFAFCKGFWNIDHFEPCGEVWSDPKDLSMAPWITPPGNIIQVEEE